MWREKEGEEDGERKIFHLSLKGLSTFAFHSILPPPGGGARPRATSVNLLDSWSVEIQHNSHNLKKRIEIALKKFGRAV